MGKKQKQVLPVDGDRCHGVRSVCFTGAMMVVIIAVCSTVVKDGLRCIVVLLSKRGVKFGDTGLTGQAHAQALAAEVSHYLQACASGLWILWAIPPRFANRAVVAWLLLANFYVHRLYYGYGSMGVPFHGFHLVMVALTAHEFGLSQCRRIGRLAHRYWMLVCFLCAFLWTPGMHGSLGIQPPDDIILRGRFVVIEAVLVVGWLCAGQDLVDPKIFSEDKLHWVNEWALLAFLAHQAVHWVVKSPINWCVLLALGPLCWLGRRLPDL